MFISTFLIYSVINFRDDWKPLELSLTNTRVPVSYRYGTSHFAPSICHNKNVNKLTCLHVWVYVTLSQFWWYEVEGAVVTLRTSSTPLRSPRMQGVDRKSKHCKYAKYYLAKKDGIRLPKNILLFHHISPKKFLGIVGPIPFLIYEVKHTTYCIIYKGNCFSEDKFLDKIWDRSR